MPNHKSIEPPSVQPRHGGSQIGSFNQQIKGFDNKHQKNTDETIRRYYESLKMS